jgi:elongation factor G
MPEDRSPLLLSVAVDARWPKDRDRLHQLLAQLARKREALRVDIQSDGAAIICAGSEDDLEGVIGQLSTISLKRDPMQIAYRETITRAVEHRYTHKKRVEGVGEFAGLSFRIVPGPREIDLEFISEVPSGNLPEPYISAVRQGVETAMRTGPLAGFPMLGLRFTLLDGAYHDHDSSVTIFQTAAGDALRDAAASAAPRVLEPIMFVAVTVP